MRIFGVLLTSIGALNIGNRSFVLKPASLISVLLFREALEFRTSSDCTESVRSLSLSLAEQNADQNIAAVQKLDISGNESDKPNKLAVLTITEPVIPTR